jgi:hypothetical protein
MNDGKEREAESGRKGPGDREWATEERTRKRRVWNTVVIQTESTAQANGKVTI